MVAGTAAGPAARPAEPQPLLLLATDEEERVPSTSSAAYMGSSAMDDELRACYAFARWLTANPCEAMPGVCEDIRVSVWQMHGRWQHLVGRT